MATRIGNYKKRELRNKSFLSSMKTEKKKYIVLTKDKNKEESEVSFRNLDRTLQRLRSKGILHSNTVSRMLSRLAKYKEF
jgi:ribosomal protein S20